MADNLLGGHRRIVEELSSKLRALQRGDLTAPRVVLLSAPAGEGKTRIIRELFARLRAASSTPQYWPELGGGGRSGTEDPIASRKQVTPEYTNFDWPSGALPGFGWWGFDCERLSASVAHGVVAAARPQWETHGLALMLAWNEAAGLWRRGARDAGQTHEAIAGMREADDAALGERLTEAGVAVPYVGSLESWGWRGASALVTRQQHQSTMRTELDLGPQAPDSEQAQGIALGRTLRSLSHPRLPGVIVIEDMQLMGAELAALVEEASVADPDRPMLVIGTVRPEGPQHPEFESWLARSRGRHEFIEVPQLPAADLITLLRESAPNTDDATAMRVVARLGGPLYLKLWLTSAAIRQHIERHGGAIELGTSARGDETGEGAGAGGIAAGPEAAALPEAAAFPERAHDVLRERWDELPDAVRAVLACAVVANPRSSDALAHFAPEVLAEVCDEFLSEAFTPSQIRDALEASAGPSGWCRAEQGVQFFRDGLLAEAARSAALAELRALRERQHSIQPPAQRPPAAQSTGKVGLRALTRKRIERWIDEAHDEYTLPETEVAALLARWYVALGAGPVPTPPGAKIPSAKPTGALAAAQWRIACDAAARFDYTEAVAQGRHALTTLRRVLGENHPAEYLRDQATQLSRETQHSLLQEGELARDTEELVHLQVAPEWAMQLVIAEWLGNQSHPAESIDALRTLLAEMERHAGTRHLATLTVRRDLAGQLSDAGIAEEAIGQFQTVIADLSAVVGPLAAETLDARGGLAEAFGVSGQYDAAVGELRALIPLFLKTYGETHPDTFLVRGALAAFLSQSGQPRAAAEQARMLLEDQEQALGVDDPQVLTTRNNLAVMLLDGGDPDAAVEQFEQLVTERAEVLGSTNPDTLDTRMNLAMAMLEAGRPQDAVREFRATLAVMQQTMAPGHPSVLRGRGQLADALGKAGDARAAAVALRALERDMARSFGARAAEIAMVAEAARYWERGGPS